MEDRFRTAAELSASINRMPALPRIDTPDKKNNNNNPLLYYILGIVSTLSFISIIWLCIVLFSNNSDKTINIIPSTSTPIETTYRDYYQPKNRTDIDAEHSRDKAIEYVKTKSVYNRTEMEKYPDLKGLWDDMNNYNFEALACGKWSAILKEANRYKLIEEIEFNIKNKTRTKFPATFNAVGDESFTYKNYLFTVSNARSGRFPSVPKNYHEKDKTNETITPYAQHDDIL